MARRRAEGRHHVDIWPGFVDALSTLLLSTIFLLVVFVLAQFFLGQLLQGRTEAVQRLESRVSDLTSQLGLEEDAASDLRRTLARINGDLQQAFLDRDELSADLGQSESERTRLQGEVTRLTGEQALLQRALEEVRLQGAPTAARVADLERELAAAREAFKTDKQGLELQLGQLVQLKRDIEALQAVRQDLEGKVAALSTQLAGDAGERERLLAELGTARDRSKALEANLAGAEERTMLAQRDVQARELRLEDLEGQLGSARSDRDQAVEQARRLTEQVAALNQQMATIQRALDLKEDESADQQATIEKLGQRLNAALAAKVEELSQYRSEFFGELRRALGERPGIQIVGDRFVFQSEVIFTSGSDLIEPRGRDELAQIAATLKDIAAEIPPDLPWVLQVDGHTDPIPISNPRFPSNWELSAARAIAVAKFLIEQGIPPNRVAARGFAQYQPLVGGNTPEAYERDRRIELKLTTR